MAELLLDTTVFDDYRCGDSKAREVFDRVMRGEIRAAVSSLTIFRLWSDPNLDRRTEIGYTGMLSFLEEVPVTLDVARTAGLWIAAQSQDEKACLDYFALVAATAQERGESVCTRNPEPFLRFYQRVVEY